MFNCSSERRPAWRNGGSCFCWQCSVAPPEGRSVNRKCPRREKSTGIFPLRLPLKSSPCCPSGGPTPAPQRSSWPQMPWRPARGHIILGLGGLGWGGPGGFLGNGILEERLRMDALLQLLMSSTLLHTAMWLLISGACGFKTLQSMNNVVADGPACCHPWWATGSGQLQQRLANTGPSCELKLNTGLRFRQQKHRVGFRIKASRFMLKISTSIRRSGSNCFNCCSWATGSPPSSQLYSLRLGSPDSGSPTILCHHLDESSPPHGLLHSPAWS